LGSDRWRRDYWSIPGLSQVAVRWLEKEAVARARWANATATAASVHDHHREEASLSRTSQNGNALAANVSAATAATAGIAGSGGGGGGGMVPTSMSLPLVASYVKKSATSKLLVPSSSSMVVAVDGKGGDEAVVGWQPGGGLGMVERWAALTHVFQVQELKECLDRRGRREEQLLRNLEHHWPEISATLLLHQEEENKPEEEEEVEVEESRVVADKREEGGGDSSAAEKGGHGDSSAPSASQLSSKKKRELSEVSTVGASGLNEPPRRSSRAKVAVEPFAFEGDKDDDSGSDAPSSSKAATRASGRGGNGSAGGVEAAAAESETTTTYSAFLSEPWGLSSWEAAADVSSRSSDHKKDKGAAAAAAGKGGNLALQCLKAELLALGPRALKFSFTPLPNTAITVTATASEAATEPSMTDAESSSPSSSFTVAGWRRSVKQALSLRELVAPALHVEHVLFEARNPKLACAQEEQLLASIVAELPPDEDDEEDEEGEGEEGDDEGGGEGGEDAEQDDGGGRDGGGGMDVDKNGHEEGTPFCDGEQMAPSSPPPLSGSWEDYVSMTKVSITTRHENDLTQSTFNLSISALPFLSIS